MHTSSYETSKTPRKGMNQLPNRTQIVPLLQLLTTLAAMLLPALVVLQCQPCHSSLLNTYFYQNKVAIEYAHGTVEKILPDRGKHLYPCSLVQEQWQHELA